MYISELNIQNYGGFKLLKLEEDLSPDPHMNIFYGKNGAGKSTVLEAVATLLSWQSMRFWSASSQGKPIAVDKVKNGEIQCRLGICVTENSKHFCWDVIKYWQGGSTVRSNLKEIAELNQTYTPETVPLIIYYPVTRSVLDIPLRIRHQHSFEPHSAFDKAFSDGADFRTFFEWFRVQEDLENEAHRDNRDAAPDPLLSAVRRALETFMPNFTQWRIRRSPLRMEVYKDGERYTVNQLSNGEKCLLALVGDLARRLALLNTGLENPLQGAGIVLIDEIDLHLHPAWQQTIVSQLHSTFPNCQFFITTHSPLVLNQVPPEKLYMLYTENGEIIAARPENSYGKTGEQRGGRGGQSPAGR